MFFCCRLTRFKGTKCRTFHGVEKLYFNGHHLSFDLIPDRCGDIIDRAPLIGPIDDVSSVEKKQVMLGKS